MGADRDIFVGYFHALEGLVQNRRAFFIGPYGVGVSHMVRFLIVENTGPPHLGPVVAQTGQYVGLAGAEHTTIFFGFSGPLLVLGAGGRPDANPVSDGVYPTQNALDFAGVAALGHEPGAAKTRFRSDCG